MPDLPQKVDEKIKRQTFADRTLSLLEGPGLAVFSALLLFPSLAYADCGVATGPCARDSYGNTYHTEQNLGGGYNTYRNGVLNSQTQQNLNNDYTTRYQDGSSSTSNFNPYDSRRDVSPQPGIGTYQKRSN